MATFYEALQGDPLSPYQLQSEEVITVPNPSGSIEIALGLGKTSVLDFIVSIRDSPAGDDLAQ